MKKIGYAKLVRREMCTQPKNIVMSKVVSDRSYLQVDHICYIISVQSILNCTLFVEKVSRNLI